MRLILGRHRARASRLRAVAAAAGIALLALSAAGCGDGSDTGLTAARLQSSIGGTFANLYVLQQADQGNPPVRAASLKPQASCEKGGNAAAIQTGSGMWLCSITYLVAGPGYPVTARYNVDLQTDGCYKADGDGPASVNGSPTITGPGYQQVINPLSLIDGCFDTTQ